MNRRMVRIMFAATTAAACGAAQSATVLEYRHEGECATEFERMANDGLRLRIDMRVDGIEMTSLVDDEEQLMHQVMHDSRSYMTMESDDDAVDFNSDVARSTLLHARNECQRAQRSNITVHAEDTVRHQHRRTVRCMFQLAHRALGVAEALLALHSHAAHAALERLEALA